MDTRLNVFYTAALLSSFTKAAQALNLTQPAITFQIKNLEDEYNTRLFDRDANKISLTHAGKILFRRTERIIEQYEKIKSEIAEVTGHYTGNIRIGVASLLGKYWLPKLIGHFKNENPGVEILMLVGNSGKLVSELKQYALDIIIISEPLNDNRLITKPFIKDELVVIVNPSHKWVHRKEIEVSNLFEENIIDREEGSGTREVFSKFLASNNMKIKDLKVVMTMGSSEAVKSAVESGVAYGIISKIAVRRELDLGLLKRIKIKDNALKRNFIIAYPKNNYNKFLVMTFIEFLLLHEKKCEL